MTRITLGIIMSLVVSACASTPTASRVEIPSQVPADIAAQLIHIGPVVEPPATQKLYLPLSEREPYAGVLVRRDVAYGPDARHLLDVFRPQGATGSRPVLVFVHGGAFTGGNRRTGDSPFYDNIMLWAVREGMVGVNMTYRLAPTHAWPAAQQDIQAALNWVRANIAASAGDPNKVILMGHSAGAAHVAQYLAFPQFHAVPGSGLAGAAMLSGIFDPATAAANPPLQSYFGKDPSLYKARSAVPGLIASNVPMLLAYAELDPPDFHTQNEQLNAELCKAGKCQGLYKLMGQSHMSEVYSINTPDKEVASLLKGFLNGL